MYLFVDFPSDYMPIPMIEVHGTIDDTVPYYISSDSSDFFYGRGAVQNIELWKEANGCQTGPVETEVNDSGGENYTVTSYSDCTADANVKLITIPDIGHVPYKINVCDICDANNAEAICYSAVACGFKQPDGTWAAPLTLCNSACDVCYPDATCTDPNLTLPGTSVPTTQIVWDFLKPIMKDSVSPTTMAVSSASRSSGFLTTALVVLAAAWRA